MLQEFFPPILEVEVRRKHLILGSRRDPKHCPVALALKERYPTAEVIVGHYSCRILVARLDAGYYQPYEPASFQARFDRGPGVIRRLLGFGQKPQVVRFNRGDSTD